MGSLLKIFSVKPSARSSNETSSNGGHVLQGVAVPETPAGSNSGCNSVVEIFTDAADECTMCKCNHGQPPVVAVTTPLHQ